MLGCHAHTIKMQSYASSCQAYALVRKDSEAATASATTQQRGFKAAPLISVQGSYICFRLQQLCLTVGQQHLLFLKPILRFLQLTLSLSDLDIQLTDALILSHAGCLHAQSWVFA